MYSSPSREPTEKQDQIAFLRLQSQLKLKGSWESIFEKYGKDIDSDIVDLETGSIVENKGVLENCEVHTFGGTWKEEKPKEESSEDEFGSLLNTPTRKPPVKQPVTTGHRHKRKALNDLSSRRRVMDRTLMAMDRRAYCYSYLHRPLYEEEDDYEDDYPPSPIVYKKRPSDYYFV
jgi:hypothetical protein